MAFPIVQPTTSKYFYTYVVQWKCRCVRALIDQTFDSDFAFLLLSKWGRGQNFPDHPRALGAREKTFRILRAEKSEMYQGE